MRAVHYAHKAAYAGAQYDHDYGSKHTSGVVTLSFPFPGHWLFPRAVDLIRAADYAVFRFAPSNVSHAKMKRIRKSANERRAGMKTTMIRSVGETDVLSSALNLVLQSSKHAC